MIHWYPVALPKPNYLETSKCYLTTTKKNNNSKVEMVINIIQI